MGAEGRLTSRAVAGLLALVLCGQAADRAVTTRGFANLEMKGPPLPADAIAVVGGGESASRLAADLLQRGYAPVALDLRWPGPRDRPTSTRQLVPSAEALASCRTTRGRLRTLSGWAERRGCRRVLLISEHRHLAWFSLHLAGLSRLTFEPSYLQTDEVSADRGMLAEVRDQILDSLLDFLVLRFGAIPMASSVGLSPWSRERGSPKTRRLRF